MSELAMRKNTLSLKWLYLAWFSLVFTTLVIGTIGAIARGDPERVVLKWGIGDFAIFAIGLYTIGMIVAVLLLYHLLKRNGLGWSEVGLKGKLSLAATGYALAGVTIAFFLYPLVERILGVAGISMYWGGTRTSHLNLKSALDVILACTFAVLLGPVAEEIVYRGYILTMFTKARQNVLAAVVLSVLIFTSTHVFFGQGMLVYIFLWAFIPAFLYLKFDSLYPAILFHVLNNLIAYVLLPLVLR
jgi:membrane protease YdiL (CAAX protease family)